MTVCGCCGCRARSLPRKPHGGTGSCGAWSAVAITRSPSCGAPCGSSHRCGHAGPCMLLAHGSAAVDGTGRTDAGSGRPCGMAIRDPQPAATPRIDGGGAGQAFRGTHVGCGARGGHRALHGARLLPTVRLDQDPEPGKGIDPIEDYGAILTGGQGCGSNVPCPRSTIPFLSAASDFNLSKRSLNATAREPVCLPVEIAVSQPSR